MFMAGSRRRVVIHRAQNGIGSAQQLGTRKNSLFAELPVRRPMLPNVASTGNKPDRAPGLIVRPTFR